MSSTTENLAINVNSKLLIQILLWWACSSLAIIASKEFLQNSSLSSLAFAELSLLQHAAMLLLIGIFHLRLSHEKVRHIAGVLVSEQCWKWMLAGVAHAIGTLVRANNN